MLWTADLDRYPLLLCGPILRRVTPTTVNVFVVLKEHRWVQLRLFPAASRFDADPPLRTGPILETVRLGEHFYVGLASLDLDDADALDQGGEYAYNVHFHDTADGSGADVSLARHDFHLLTLDNEHRIGFGHEQLPSFVVPPGDLSELRILQGSCRKPHGGGVDMLASFDDVLANGDQPGPERPHLLLLGGDQIYADDVSPPLLRMIHDASTLLFGWDEELADTGPLAAVVPAVVQLDEKLTELIGQRNQEEGPWTLFDTADPTLEEQAKAAIVEALTELAALLDDAIAHATFSDDWVKNELERVKLRGALALFKYQVVTAINDVEVPTEPVDAGLAALSFLVDGIAEWVATYQQIFLPLATNREWGRVAISNEPGDLPKLEQVRDRLATLAQSTAANVDDLLDEFTAAFDVDDDFEDPNAREFRAAAIELATGLATQAGVVAGDVIDLAGKYQAHYFPGEAEDGHYRPSRISAPQRGLELKQHASMTSDAMDAHLMFLGEFALMYVFAWSDAVWPQLRSDSGRTFVLPPYFESVPNYGLTGPLGPTGLADAATTLVEFAEDLPKVRRVLANVPTLMMFDDHEITDDWNLHEDWVRAVNSKAAGTQLLRNGLIAYGIFQDWGNQPDHYLDVGDADDPEPDPDSDDPARPMGRRLLDAITYVPADPNDPADADWAVDTPSALATDPDDPPPLKPPVLFRDAAPDDTDSKVAEVNRLLGIGPQQIGQLVALTIDSLLATHGDHVAYNIVPNEGRKVWDWHYDIAAAGGDPSDTKRPVRIIALDSRTRRGFPDVAWAFEMGLSIDLGGSIDGKSAAAALINGADMTRQVSDRLEEGHLHIVVSPAPVFGLPLVEDVFQRLQVLSSGPEVADFESWQANPDGFDNLLTTLRSADCVLVSGDVHYAYSNLLSFPETESTDGVVLPPKLLLQLCSSSIKNETDLTQLLGSIGREGRLIDFIVPAIGELGEIIANAISDLPETLAELGSDLLNFGTWFDETAPLLNPFNPGAWATYYLKLKDAQLFSLNLPTPQGLIAVGGGIVAYIASDLFGSEDGVYDRDGFRMNFLTDVRGAAARRGRVATLSGRTGDQVVAALTSGVPAAEADERADALLAEMPDVVGYNNTGLITFRGPGTAGDDVLHELLWHPHDARHEPFEDSGGRVIASTRHGEFPPLAALPQRIAEVAMEEFRAWNPPSGRITEATPEGIRILERYRDALLQYDGALEAQMPNLLRFENFPIPTAAWSAMFVSYVMHRAQAGDLWFPSPRHSDYVRFAWQNGDADNDNPFRLYRKDHADAVVRVGDVVGGQPREASEPDWDEGIDDDNAHRPIGDGTPLVATHFDIVVEITEVAPRRAWIVGGNLGPTGLGTSKRMRIDLDDEGRLTGSRYGLIRAEVR